MRVKAECLLTLKSFAAVNDYLMAAGWQKAPDCS
jgi:hypothetical protein